MTIPNKAFTTLVCGHVFHRICIKKKLLLTKPNGCPSDCGRSVETITEATTTEMDLRRNSESSTSSIVGKMGKQLNIQSQEIMMRRRRIYGNKRPLEVTVEETNTMRDKVSSKKAKTKKDESSILKKLIKDLTTDVPTRVGENLKTTNTGTTTFLQLSNNIDLAEVKNEDSTRNVISRYFDLEHYRNLNHGERACLALVNDEIRKQLPDDITAISNLSQDNINYVIVEILKRDGNTNRSQSHLIKFGTKDQQYKLKTPNNKKFLDIILHKIKNPETLRQHSLRITEEIAQYDKDPESYPVIFMTNFLTDLQFGEN
ncbi:hypothetical protein Glove_71g93 [Diversispora epigaea]|uniref:RING-type domain-containing protein n=1 Tax=Diversispora epigaea TaxID=1348612 RepID=A0A397JC86_9GLOM|nr:hypothetical protein Glove_71g93 [Diversispora epigaea]